MNLKKQSNRDMRSENRKMTSMASQLAGTVDEFVCYYSSLFFQQFILWPIQYNWTIDGACGWIGDPYAETSIKLIGRSWTPVNFCGKFRSHFLFYNSRGKQRNDWKAFEGTFQVYQKLLLVRLWPNYNVYWEIFQSISKWSIRDFSLISWTDNHPDERLLFSLVDNLAPPIFFCIRNESSIIVQRFF